MKSIPSLTGETLTPLYHHNRDGERKPKRESENSTSLNTSSTGKLVMTSNFANAMPWCMDTMLPTTVISGSAEGPNETGQKSLSFQSLVPGFVFPCSSVTELYRNIRIA